MAVQFDAQATGNTVTSWSHTCSGTNRALLVYLHITFSGLTGVTYGGQSMQQLYTYNNGTWGNVYIYGLLNPPSGANTVSLQGTIPTGTNFGPDGISNSFTNVLSFGSIQRLDSTPNPPIINYTLGPNDADSNWIINGYNNPPTNSNLVSTLNVSSQDIMYSAWSTGTNSVSWPFIANSSYIALNIILQGVTPPAVAANINPMPMLYSQAIAAGIL
jgi:hypothetical protein